MDRLSQQIDAAVASGKGAKLPDSLFDDISARLEVELQNKDWSSRPRTWFVLNQIKRLDAMGAFISQGLNDTSFPYQGRASLPNAWEIHDFHDFLKWQDYVISDILDVENGRHVLLRNGDDLFEARRPILGVGSQG